VNNHTALGGEMKWQFLDEIIPDWLVLKPLCLSPFFKDLQELFKDPIKVGGTNSMMEHLKEELIELWIA
jgi:hypothetical protein